MWEEIEQNHGLGYQCHSEPGRVPVTFAFLGTWKKLSWLFTNSLCQTLEVQLAFGTDSVHIFIFTIRHWAMPIFSIRHGMTIFVVWVAQSKRRGFAGSDSKCMYTGDA
jgi:hypothetical protein